MIFDEGLFDQDLIEDFLQHYTLDAIIELPGKPTSYEMDAIVGDAHTTQYLLDSSILDYNLFASYMLDVVLVLGRNDPRFQESIINAIVWSYGQELERLSESISLMGLRLSLQNAVSDDLDLYWAKILGLKRRYNETTEDFRVRLAARLAIMKSSGTKPECESILDHILGMRGAARLETYWPGEVRLCWNSYTAMRRAQEQYAAVKGAMDDMIAAGVSWSTAFPWISYLLDTNINGKKNFPYLMDAGVTGSKYSLYLLNVDIFERNAATVDLDAYLEEGHTISSRMDALLTINPAKLQQLDALVEIGHSATYQNDAIALERRSKSEYVDAVLEKNLPRYYNIDLITEGARRGSYLLSVDLVAA
ncbi:MAG: hypothetical protein WBN94_10685 [Methanothrix sp.]